MLDVLDVLDVLREEWETPSEVEEAPAFYLEAPRKKMRASTQLAREEAMQIEP